MNAKTLFVSIALTAASGLALAQASAPASRAEVKSETRAATAQGKPTAATEGSPQIDPGGVRPGQPASSAHATRKATRAAKKANKSSM